MKLIAAVLASPVLARVPTDADLEFFYESVLPFADTLQTDDTCVADPSDFPKFLDSLGTPNQVTTQKFGNLKLYHFEFSDGSDVQVSVSRSDEVKILSCTAGENSKPTDLTPFDLTEEEYEQAQSAFASVDSNGDGFISAGGAYTAILRTALLSDIPPENGETILTKVSGMDPNGDGKVDITEFLTMERVAKEIGMLYGDFEQVDTNGDQEIDRDELAQVLEAVGNPQTTESVLDMYDQDGSETISFEEFVMATLEAQDMQDPRMSTVSPDDGVALTEYEQQVASKVFETYVRARNDLETGSNDAAVLAPIDFRNMMQLALDKYLKSKGVTRDLDCTRQSATPSRLLQMLSDGSNGMPDTQQGTGGRQGSVRMAVLDLMRNLDTIQEDDSRTISADEFMGAITLLKSEMSAPDFQQFMAALSGATPVDCTSMADCSACASVPICGWLSTTSDYAYYGGGMCVPIEDGNKSGTVAERAASDGSGVEGDVCDDSCDPTDSTCMACGPGLVCVQSDGQDPVCTLMERCEQSCDAPTGFMA